MAARLTTLAFVRRQGEVLMLRKHDPAVKDGAGRWNGLGGKLEPGEGPEACVRREVMEESGLQVEEAVYKGLLTFPYFYDDGDDCLVFVFVVPAFSGTPVASSEGSLHWVPEAEVASLPLWPGDRVFLPWLDRPETFSASLRYVGGRFEGYEVVFYGAGGVPLRSEAGTGAGV